MKTYRIRAETGSIVDASSWADRNEATVDALLEAGIGDAVGWASFARVGVVFHLSAPDVPGAASHGLKVFERALRRASVRADIAYLEVGGETEDDDEPALVGATDVARMIGVSRQRVYQLAETLTFPEAVAHLARGAMWRRLDIERWLEQRRASSAFRSADRGG